jgi:hypothetical protein
MTEPTYVFDENIEKLEKEVARLNRRAAKLSVPAIQLQIGEVEKILAGDPEAEHLRAPVSLVGTPPMLAGWTFEATVDHLSNGLITSYPGSSLDLTPFRGSDATCDHCQVNRKRHETFIVRHEDATTKRVGRTCLGDFLGHHGNPSALIGHLNLWGKAFEALESAGAAGVGAATHTLELVAFVAHVAQEMRAHGWLSRGKAFETHGTATADRAQSAYWYNGRDKVSPTPEDDIRALRAVTWARALTDSEVETNDYLYNLRAVCLDDFIRPKRGGLAGSVIVAAERAFEKAAQASSDAQKSNLHVGTVKEKIETVLTLVGLRETDGFYGVSYLHKFEDAAGNSLCWFATNPEFVRDGADKRRMNVGESLTLRGTVKKHGDFRGRNQTTLTRVTHPKPKAAKKAA